ncbi:cytochrome P450 [Allokutzneria oryzae]|uniref:Cytochrome P450 n=1 Tax=Allokutzneria oryzae TaxID=1378989 RepID=A0ABV5ZTA5_9PSEU
MTANCPARLYEVGDLPGLEFDPVLAELLRDEPVARIRLPYGEGDAWLMTRYADVKFVASDPRFSRAATLGRPVTKMTRHHIPLERAVSYSDPPEHARVRRVVAKAFTDASAEKLRPHAEQVVNELVDAMTGAGRAGELVRQVTSPFPVRVIGELLGVPAVDWPRMTEWAQTVLSVAHDQAAADRANRAKQESGEYFRALAAQRRARPEDDLVSKLVAAQADGVLDEEELVGLSLLLQFNGWHAVRNNGSNMIYLLLTRPQLWARLRGEPGLVPRAVEELLRFIPHKNGIGMPRVATEDVEVGGVLVREGEVVYVSYVAANRDPEVYPDPDRIDLEREEVPHLAFGHGPHYCMGPALARMELEVLVGTLLTRLPDLRLAIPAAQVRWHTNALIRGPIDLPVTW